MKQGQRVTYQDARGKRHAASVSEIAGTGPSGKKTLDLTYDGGEATNVPHGDDRRKGEAFWLLETETETPPERRALLDKQPIMLAKAIDEGTLPEGDRRSESSSA